MFGPRSNVLFATKATVCMLKSDPILVCVEWRGVARSKRVYLVQVACRGKTPVGKTNPKSPWFGIKYPLEMVFSTSDVTQLLAKQFLPPHCSIWRSNYRGAWCPWLSRARATS